MAEDHDVHDREIIVADPETMAENGDVRKVEETGVVSGQHPSTTKWKMPLFVFFRDVR